MQVDLEQILETIFMNLETEELDKFAKLCRSYAEDAESVYEEELRAYGSE